MATTLPIDVAGSDEQFDDIAAQSEDFTSYELIPPGTYATPSRKVITSKRVTKKGQPFIMAELQVDELVPEDGDPIQLNRPIRHWINTLMFGRKNQQGKTSEVASYLAALGFDPAQLRGDELIQALNESAAYPVKVVVGWTNMTEKTGVKLPNGKDEYTEEFAKTADFNRGTPDEPVFIPTLEKDGKSYRAKHRIVGFRKV